MAALLDATPHSVLGWALGTLDHVYALTRVRWLCSCRRKRALPSGVAARQTHLFSEGWGDLVAPLQAFSQAMQRIAAGERALPTAPISPTISPYVSRGGPPVSVSAEGTEGPPLPHEVSNGEAGLVAESMEFESPFADLLPAEARTVRCLWTSHIRLSEAVRTSGADITAVCVHMPAFGEQGYSSRRGLASRLHAADPSIASLIITAPFYASRRPRTQTGALIPTVADTLAQAMAISMEAAALLEWCARVFPAASLVVTGFSFGGAMAGTSACIAASLLGEHAQQRLGVVPCVGSATPAVIADGILADDVDWTALRDDMPRFDRVRRQLVELCEEPQLQDLGESEVPKLLFRLLLSVHTSKLVRVLKAASSSSPWLGAVSVVGAVHDHFVKRCYWEELFVELSKLAGDNRAHLVRIGGGHVTAFLARSVVFVRATQAGLRTLRSGRVSRSAGRTEHEEG